MKDETLTLTYAPVPVTVNYNSKYVKGFDYMPFDDGDYHVTFSVSAGVEDKTRDFIINKNDGKFYVYEYSVFMTEPEHGRHRHLTDESARDVLKFVGKHFKHMGEELCEK